MDIMNDPIGTKYGCALSFNTNGTEYAFSPLSTAYKEDECIRMYGTSTISVSSFKAQYGKFSKKLWGPSTTNDKVLVFNNSFELKIEKTNDLGNGMVEDITEELDASEFGNVMSINHTRVIVAPKDQLFISDAIYLSSHPEQTLRNIDVSGTNMVLAGGAISTDNKTWYTYNQTAKKWEKVDITRDIETLKTTMGNIISPPSYDILGIPVKKIYMALLFTIVHKVITSTQINYIQIHTTQNADNHKQLFNFVKVGYTPSNGVKLIADRNILYTTSYYIFDWLISSLSEGDINKQMSDLIYYVYPGLIQSKVSKQEEANPHDEWKDLIEFTETGGLSAKEFWHIDSPSLTNGIFLDNAELNSNIIITRGSSDDIESINITTPSVIVGFRPQIEVRANKHIECIPGKPQLPEVTKLKDIKKGTCISCDFFSVSNNSLCGLFGNLGKATLPLYSDGRKYRTESNEIFIESGSFYFICIGYNNYGEPMLVPDRPIASGPPGMLYMGSAIGAMVDPLAAVDLAIAPAFSNASNDGRLYTIDGVAIKQRNITSNITPNLDRSDIFDEYERIFSNELNPSLKPEEIWHHDKTYTMVQNYEYKDSEALYYRVYRDHNNNVRLVASAFNATTNIEDRYVAWRPIITIDRTPRVVSMEIDRSVIHYDDTEFNVNIDAVDEDYNPIEYSLKMHYSAEKAIISDYSMDRERKIEVDTRVRDLFNTCYASKGLVIVSVYVKINNVETPISYFLMFGDNFYKSRGTGIAPVFGPQYSGLEYKGVFVVPSVYDEYMCSFYPGPEKAKFKTDHGYKYVDIPENLFKITM